LTEQVLATMAGARSPRLRELGEALVRHLHAFVAETRPTRQEWADAIAFLTRTGHACTPSRQEFILLSDVLGVSMLVEEINDLARAERASTEPARAERASTEPARAERASTEPARAERASTEPARAERASTRSGDSAETSGTVVGPFYRPDPPELPLGADIAGGAAGEPLLVQGTVRCGGEPVTGAVVDTWQADDEGFYDVQRGDATALRARFRTDAEGRFHFWSVVPADYPIPDDGPVGDLLSAFGRHPYRPAHVHIRLTAPGCRELVTHVFLAGSRYLASDVVFGVREDLVTDVEHHEPGRAPDGRDMRVGYAVLRYDFTLGVAAST
jgi:hydroxyquinol 1,2-dioxygenase